MYPSRARSTPGKVQLLSTNHRAPILTKVIATPGCSVPKRTEGRFGTLNVNPTNLKSKISPSVTRFVGRDSPWGGFGVRVGSVGDDSDWSSAKRNRLRTKLVGTLVGTCGKSSLSFCSLILNLLTLADRCRGTGTCDAKQSRKNVYGVCPAA